MNHDSPPTSVRYHVLAVVCSLAVIAYIQRLGFISSSQPFVSRSLDFSSQDEGRLAAMFLMAYALFEMPWGMLADRWGARRLLPMLVVCWSLLLACAALGILLEGHWLAAFLFMLSLRFLFGLFQAGGFPVISRIIADWIPRQERGFCQGCIWLSTRLGATVLPLLLHQLIIKCGNWHVPFLILSTLGLIWAPLFWMWFRNRPEETSTVNQAELDLIAHGRGQQAGHGAVPWKRMLGSRSVWALCFVYGCTGFAGNFYTSMLANYLARVRAIEDGERKWMESVPFLFGAVACLTGGWISDWLIRRTGSRKWGRRLMGTFGLTVGGALWLCVPMVETRWVLGAVLCLIFFCNDLVLGPAWASCADIGERHAGILGGAMNMIGSVLGAAGQLLAGYLIGAQHSPLLFTCYAASYWVGAILMQQVDVTKTLADDDNRLPV